MNLILLGSKALAEVSGGVLLQNGSVIPFHLNSMAAAFVPWNDKNSAWSSL